MIPIVEVGAILSRSRHGPADRPGWPKSRGAARRGTRSRSCRCRNREPQPLPQRARVGHHVGAFEQNGADARVARHQGVAGIEDVLLRGRDIHRRLVADQDARELPPALGADDRRRRIDIDRRQMVAVSVAALTVRTPTSAPAAGRSR